MKKENGVLTDVTLDDIKLLQNNPEEFWEGVTEIGKHAFEHAAIVKSIFIPEGGNFNWGKSICLLHKA